MSEELKPCPFCAGKPEIHTQMVSRYQFVSCSRCRCDGPLKERTRDAIACWNRRASPTPEEEVRREAEEMFLAPSGQGKYAADWADKPHRVLYDAVNLIRALSLQVG